MNHLQPPYNWYPRNNQSTSQASILSLQKILGKRKRPAELPTSFLVSVLLLAFLVYSFSKHKRKQNQIQKKHPQQNQTG